LHIGYNATINVNFAGTSRMIAEGRPGDLLAYSFTHSFIYSCVYYKATP